MSKVYTGTGRLFQEVESLPLDEEGLRDIDRRIKVQPHFLGEPLVVIGEAQDFPQLDASAGHTMLALDVKGRAVIISLTIGVADVHTDTSALQVAAFVSGLHPQDLGKIARSFISRPSNDHLLRAWEELGVEMSDEAVELSSLLAATFERDAEDYAELINQEQRIVIAAEGFTARLVDLIRWLCDSGVQVKGLRYCRYLVGGQEIYFAEQVMPKVDPAVDAPVREDRGPSLDATEPWRSKGRAYHADRLMPAVAHLLDEFLRITRPATFSINWSHKYYFWVRGAKRNLRVRTYFRDRLEIGFYNASPQAVGDFLEQHGLTPEVNVVGGYTDSPFVTIMAGTEFNDAWTRMLNAWLGGEEAAPARSTTGMSPAGEEGDA